ncbi:hypothetical protein Glove_277g21 [Diversispora epigaea]|uniref:Uncharacterized protein n=1 Tax=Diversispora epigaea TaxID=1348612 RepID=A0A397I2K8_9GLOM|nr:hypothetical protein Glove_277g21 [Diversispora epigaea]
MRSSLEALSLPIMASSLMSPLSAYMLLTLLIIAVIWFVILRREFGIGKKSGQLWDIWNSRGGQCLSNNYINCNTPLRWKCAKGHEWTANFHSIKNGKTWCFTSSGNFNRRNIP